MDVFATVVHPFPNLIILWIIGVQQRWSLSSYRIGFLQVMANGSQVELFLGLREPFGRPSLTVLLFPMLFLLSGPYVL